MLPCSVWIGFDPRESAAFAVARATARARMVGPMPVRGLVLEHLQAQGLYTRPTRIEESIDGPLMIDELSATAEYSGAMSTQFAISRFLIPELVRRSQRNGSALGWALFMDCDVLIRGNLGRLFDFKFSDQKHAVRVVKHNYQPKSSTKMDGQLQTTYPRKNWSSVMLFNCDHPKNKLLTPEVVNSWPGRDLHAFRWLDDEDDIGDLGPEWNYLVGETQCDVEPRIIHFTNGGPWMRGYENVPFADEWRRAHNDWAR